MSWLHSIDVALFRFINGTLANSFFDDVMPVFAGNAWFWPVLIICGVSAIWKGGARGRLCVLMLAIVLPLGDGWITNTLKHAIERPRPCLVLENVNLPMKKSHSLSARDEYRQAGCSSSGSFPSGHTANWFAATMVTWMFYRRTLRFMLPLACIVGFSRVYNGVHYPTDILGGIIIGSGYGAAIVIALDGLWRVAGSRIFPLWWAALPSLLLRNDRRPTVGEKPSGAAAIDLSQHWLRLGYVVIGLALLGRLVYLAAGLIELSEDEAYQWLWSKHPALSYYSKPPMIAWVQWAGTHLWGDTAFGVRFFSPVLAALGGLVLLRFFSRHVNARAGFWLVVVITVTPLLALGSTLLTVDPLLVFFWTLAMVSGWNAVKTGIAPIPAPSGSVTQEGTTKWWAWTGVWMGLAFLSKYTALFLWLSWAVFFVLWKPARTHLRRPGPYVALLINLLLALPVLIWNAQHGWVTAGHVATDAKLRNTWHFDPNNFLEFIGGAAALMHPLFFVGVLSAAAGMWKRRDPLLRYFFAMGAPVFVFYLFYTIHSNVLVNWIAAAIVPLFCLMVAWWDQREREGVRGVRTALGAAVVLGAAFVAFMHESTPFLNAANDIRAQFSMPPLDEKMNPHRRVRGWSEMAKIVERARRNLEVEGKPVFLIGGHYGTTSLLSFYTADARTNLTSMPLAYCRQEARPKTQFFYWPTYVGARQGQNALYVQEKDKREPAPDDVVRAFASVEDVGYFPIVARGRMLHHVHIFACRGLLK